MEEISVLHQLPKNMQKILCFGHKTCCCTEDMEETALWHEVIFKFNVSYRCKKEMPTDLEESILERTEVHESWEVEENGTLPAHIIGVTKWKKI